VQREQDWEPEFVMLVDPAGRRLPVSLQLASSPPAEPVRVHADLYTREQARPVDRLVELGATRVDDWPYPDGADLIVLRDPEGNEFCVIDHPELWARDGRPSKARPPQRRSGIWTFCG
jgi:hypothetical protein